jgi:hypothetical protein
MFVVLFSVFGWAPLRSRQSAENKKKKKKKKEKKKFFSWLNVWEKMVEPGNIVIFNFAI